MEDASENFSLESYYSLVELLDKIGKEGVSELVAKGRPQRITRGDMIYFHRQDVNNILGRDLYEDSDSVELIVDDTIHEEIAHTWLADLVFRKSLVKRFKVGKEEVIYQNQVIDPLEGDVLIGRSHGDKRDQDAFSSIKIVSSLHGRLYIDEDGNLLYENLGANKSKVRGLHEKTYETLDEDEIGVLIPREAMEELQTQPQTLITSIKIGFQQNLILLFVLPLVRDNNQRPQT